MTTLSSLEYKKVPELEESAKSSIVRRSESQIQPCRPPRSKAEQIMDALYAKGRLTAERKTDASIAIAEPKELVRLLAKLKIDEYLVAVCAYRFIKNSKHHRDHDAAKEPAIRSAISREQDQRIKHKLFTTHLFEFARKRYMRITRLK